MRSDQNGTGARPQSETSECFADAAHPHRGKRQKARPFSIRLTEVERTALKVAAGTKPVGVFARERLLDDAAARKFSRRPAPDAALLGQILASLGRSGLVSSLADLGRAAKAGTIEITPEIETQIQLVCADIQEVKRMLVRGLGLVEEQSR